MNSDATDFVLPNPERQAECMELALKRAGLNAEDIDIVSTHATGTPSGDVQECDGPAAACSAARQRLRIQQHQELHRPRDGRGRGAGTGRQPAGVRRRRRATPRSTSTSSIPSATLPGLVLNEPREVGGVEYILNNSFGMLGINSVVIIKRI